MSILTQEIMVSVLTFFSVVAIGGSIVVSRMQKRKIVETRLKDNTGTEEGEPVSHKKSGILQFLQKVGNIVSHGHPSTDLYEQLIRAGYLGTTAPAIYTGIKMLLFVIGLAGTAILVIPVETYFTTKITLIFLGGAIVFFVPNVVVVLQLRKRHEEICRHLPEAIDLLEICVSSGIGLDMAWNIVADEVKHVSPVLANAMALTNFEIHLGVSRAEAMRHMAVRTAVDELSSLAALLTQTDRFGTSIADTLRIFAASMREERSSAIEENAEKLVVKLLFPMVLFIFPAVLITAVGPAVITITEVLF
jgi:tight adherence protein C